MKRQIRRGVFETNSSSTHSLTMCSEEEFEQWKNGKVLFDEDGETFVKASELSNKDKEYAETAHSPWRIVPHCQYDRVIENRNQIYFFPKTH